MADPPVPPPALANPAPVDPKEPAENQPGNTPTSTKLVTFKPEFAGRPEEDAEAHLLHTNDWMITNNFPDDVKVQRFCLTLT